MGKMVFGDDEFRQMFNDAAKRFEDDSNGRIVLRDGNISQVEKLVPIIAAVIPFNAERQKVSVERLRTAIRAELQKRRALADPAQDFVDHIRNFQMLLHTLPEEDYEAWMPVPIVGRTGDTLPTLEANGVVFEPQPHSEWDGMTSEAGENWSRVLEQNHHDLNPRKFTPYRCVVKARDQAFAALHVTSALRVALGIANFSSYYNRGYPFRIGGSGSRRWSNLRGPFVFLVKTPSGRFLVWREDDDSYRHPHAHTGWEKQRFDEMSPQLPKLDSSNQYDELILTGFAHLQDAMTSATFTEMFSHFWRGIEALAQTSDRDPSARNIQRMAGLIGYKDEPQLLKRRQERMADIRNSIIHRGDDNGLDRSDIDFIAATLEGALETYVNNRERYSLADLQYIMDLPSDEGLLKMQKAATKRHGQLLDEAIKWRSKAGGDEEE